MPAVVTLTDEVVAPVLHNKDPVAVVESVEFPQLSETVTTGVDGTDLGVAVPLPGGLVHPFIVLVTVYTPAVLTVIDEVVAPLLHNKTPVAVVERVELPQESITVTTGIGGIGIGADVPLPGILVHPLTVEVTE